MLYVGTSAPAFACCSHPPFYGSQIGSEAIVRALLQASSVYEITLFALNEQHARLVRGHLDAQTPSRPRVHVQLMAALPNVIGHDRLDAYLHCDMGPRLLEVHRLRQQLGGRVRIIGYAHALSSTDVVDSLHDLLSCQLRYDDCLLTSSTAATASLRKLIRVLEPENPHAYDFLIYKCPIPVDAERFSPGSRKFSRLRLGFSQSEFILLGVGRLDNYYKQDIDPVLEVVQRVIKKGGRDLRLVLAGSCERAHERLIREMICRRRMESSVTLLTNLPEDVKPVLFQCADLFLAPYDSIQESYGISVVEAMAAGLPVVAANWDGLRETVVHGQTGFLVDTYLPSTISIQLATNADSQSHLVQGQVTALDLQQMGRYISDLMESIPMRKALGTAGRKRVSQFYDIPSCTASLDAILTNNTPAMPQGVHGVPPGQGRDMNFLDAFSHYASHYVDSATLVRRGLRQVDWSDSWILAMREKSWPFGDRKAIIELLEASSSTPTTIAQLARGTSEEPSIGWGATCCWLLKHGYLEVAPGLGANPSS